MTLIEKYNNLLLLTTKVVKYNRIRKGRGYLTDDEKRDLNSAERKLETIVKEQSTPIELFKR